MVNHAAPSLPDAKTLSALRVIEHSFAEAELELARRQAKLFKPLFEKRDALIAAIPNFWPTVFEENDDLAELISLEDQALLSHLTAMQITRDETEPREYTITFTFESNQFLEDDSLVITKAFSLAHQDDRSPDATLVSEPVAIKWKPDQDLTRRNLGRPSFFTFFEWAGGEQDTFQEGEEVAAILADALYPDALKVWTEAVSIDEDEGDSEEDKSVDIDASDEEAEVNANEEPQRKRVKV